MPSSGGSGTAPGALTRAWYRWKSLRLPWRKTWLVGADLMGNTFWEFKDAINAGRLRRIVRYGSQTHYADIKISPQWHQWLRHTRDAAPTLQEQHIEVARQERMKYLAAEADERWKSIPSYLDTSHVRKQTQPAIGAQDSTNHAFSPAERDAVQEAQGAPDAEGPTEAASEALQQEQLREQAGVTKNERRREQNPWFKKQQQGAPSENWQPEAWSPGVARKR